MSVTLLLNQYLVKPEGRHRLSVRLLTAIYTAAVVSVSVYGFGYYRLAPPQRAFHPLNGQLRPSGSIGIALALASVTSFAGIYLYAVRKRWKWLSKIGKTKNWLDVHIVLGVAAPALATLHSAFKTRGLAGAAYWIMIAVMLSGFVGRYFYAQIPRRINAAELSLQEMQNVTDELTRNLESQYLISREQLQPLLAVPTQEEVESLSVGAAVLVMLAGDIKRPFLVARLRRRFLSTAGKIATLGGLLPSRAAHLEKVISLAKRRSWMAAKITFLAKTHQVFNLWHVIHRPFSYAFALLIGVHITVALLMGYF